MLALSRQVGEKIVLSMDGKDICRLSVVDVKGDKVRLSFDAPKEVSIFREELLKKDDK